MESFYYYSLLFSVLAALDIFLKDIIQYPLVMCLSAIKACPHLNGYPLMDLCSKNPYISIIEMINTKISVPLRTLSTIYGLHLIYVIIAETGFATLVIVSALWFLKIPLTQLDNLHIPTCIFICRSFYHRDPEMELEKCITPYGGRLVWTLPGQNKLIVHLKDKNKIRHKKRWSQVYYHINK